MAKSRPSDAGYKGFSDPSVTKIEWYRGYTTKNPLQLDNKRVSRTLLDGKLSKVKEKIINQYEKSAKGRFLKAHNIPPIVFNEKSLEHDFSKRNTSRQKLSILTDYDRMNHLLSKGTVLEKRVKTTSRSGKHKGNKEQWSRFWEVKGRTFIGNKDHIFTFSIMQIKGESISHVYDFKLREKK